MEQDKVVTQLGDLNAEKRMKETNITRNREKWYKNLGLNIFLH